MNLRNITVVLMVMVGFGQVFAAQSLPPKEGTVQVREVGMDQQVFPEWSSTSQAPASQAVRNQRQQLETETNEKVLEQIESARLQDEKARQQRLLVEKELKQKAQIQPLAAATQVSTSTDSATAETSEGVYSVSLLGGALNYPRFANLPTLNGVTGAAVGARIWRSLSLEAGFLYSFQQQEINQAVRTVTEDIDQMMVSVQAKYTWIMPSLDWLALSPGAVLAYNRKVYEGGENSSDAVDAGLSATADFLLTSNWSLGLEYRFMFNLDYQRELGADPAAAALQQLASGNQTANLEEAEYQMLLLNLKYTF